MRTIPFYKFAPFFILLVLIASACAAETSTPTGGGTPPPAETPLGDTPQAVHTFAAETMSVQLTLSAGGTAVAQLTELAGQPTAPPIREESTPTPAAPTVTFPTQTPAPLPTLTPTLPCDQAEFVGDVNSLQNTAISPGANFTKIWRVRNTGSCMWTPAYALVFAGGTQMSGPTAVFLPANIRPGDMVDLAITLTAPNSPGLYRNDWLLRNPSGALIGFGPGISQPLSLEVQVAGAPSAPMGTFDLAARACEAVWRSSTAALGCPGSTNDPNGSIVLLDNPSLESRQENEPALWVRPNEGRGGRITGLYPSYIARQGDHFLSEVGCLRDNPDCDLLFVLEYRAVDGNIYELGEWREDYDRRTTSIDIDLSSLAGDTIQLILSTENRGSSGDANGLWFAPHIRGGSAPTSNQILTWSQRGGADNVCEELKIFLNTRNEGTAQARSCRDGRDLGSILLNQEELNQLLSWLDQLAPFDAELFNADKGEPLTSFMTFQGRGREEASNAHIVALQDYSQRLFNRIAR
jgi:hypothetical protein